MKAEDLSDAIGKVEDKWIAEADRARRMSRPSRRFWLPWVAVAVCLCLVVGAVLSLPVD